MIDHGDPIITRKHNPPYGALYEHNTPLQFVWGVGDADVWKDISGLTAGGVNYRVTETAASGELTILDSGIYMVLFSFSASANAGLELHCQLAINDGTGYTRSGKVACRRTLAAGSIYGDFTGGPMPLELTAGTILKIQAQSDTASRTLTVDHVQFSCLWIRQG